MDRNPLLERIRRSGHGRKAEKKAARRMGAEQTRASGALDFDKGDYENPKFLFDSKATIHKSYSLKYADLQKLRKEAQGKKKIPALHVQFTNAEGDPIPHGGWLVIPEWLMDHLTEV